MLNWEDNKKIIEKLSEIREDHMKQAMEYEEKEDYRQASLTLSRATGVSDAINLLLKS